MIKRRVSVILCCLLIVCFLMCRHRRATLEQRQREEQTVRLSLSAEDYFALPASRFSIAEGALVIARKTYPKVDIEQYLGCIRSMADEVRQTLRSGMKPPEIIAALAEYLFKKKGFKFKPTNISSFNMVLSRKTGDCMGLAVLYLALAEELGLPITGMSAPNHVYLMYRSGGRRFNIDQCREGVIAPDEFFIQGYRIPPETIKRGVYMQPLRKKQILARLIIEQASYLCVRKFSLEAIKEYDLAITMDENMPEAFEGRAAQYLYLKDYPRVIQDCSKALALHPYYADAWYQRGLAYHWLRKTRRAIRDYTRVIELDPQKATAFKNRGKCYIRLGEPDLAENDFAEAKRLKSGD